MKKYIFALLLCAGFALPALGQSGNPPITITEVDGSPRVTSPTKIVVSNGSLTVSGKTATIVTGGGGGGGTPGGSNTQVQYNAAGSFGGAAGFTFNGTSTISLGVAGSSVGAIGFRNATSGTITLQPVTGALGTVTLSLPAVTDTLVGLAATQTLTNKTLTTPVIAQISNTGTLTLPTSTDTLVGRATTDTLTNKTLSTSNTVSAALTWTAGVKQTFAPNGTTAGINVGSVAGDPSAPANGDLWYDSTANELTARINGANVALGSGGGGGITIGTTTITSGTNTRVLYNNAGVVGEYTVTGTAGNVVLSTSPTITTPAITTSQTTTRDSIGVTSTDGIVLQNTAAAAAGAQQYSPRLRLTGQGWKTNATAASQTVDWAVETQPVQGTANPTSLLSFASQINGAGFSTPVLQLRSAGNIEIKAVDSSTACAICFTGDSTNGFTHPAAGQYGIAAAGYEMIRVNSTGLGIGRNGGSGVDVTLVSTATGALRFGTADAASPVAQTLSVQNVVGGTSNTAGVNWTHIGSRGTGTGVGGDIIFQTAPAGSSGTSQNTLVNAFTVKGNGAVQLLSVTFANLPTVANGFLIYCSDCTIASPCASGGSGALAKGINGAWVCN